MPRSRSTARPCCPLCGKGQHATLCVMKAEREIAPESSNRIFRASPFFCLLFCLSSAAVVHSAEPPVKTFELTIPRSAAPAKPRTLLVEKDDVVRLRATSEAAGEIHLHGYRLEMKLEPGTPQELSFKARATGRYRIEWHPAREAAQTGDHHGPPLATLEVRPK